MRGEADQKWQLYSEIVQWFLDDPQHPFSIHQIVRCGWEECQVAIGKWYGPSTIAHVLKRLLEEAQHEPKLRAYVAQDLGTIYRDQVEDMFKNYASILILVPTRLGIDEINPAYYSAICATLELAQSVGIAG
jgi:cysteine protease ATG4